MSLIPKSHLDMFERPLIATLSSHLPSGHIQVNPVWVSYDGIHVSINSAKGRVKDKNMRAAGKVTIFIVEPDNAYRWIEVRGEVDTITEDGADANIDQHSQKYLGKPYPWRKPDEIRVLYKIKPTKVNVLGE